MAYFLALDIGGTKTDYLLADETRELARVRTGTIKRMRIDASTAIANLDQALSELTAAPASPRRTSPAPASAPPARPFRSSPTGSAKPSPTASPASSSFSAM